MTTALDERQLDPAVALAALDDNAPGLRVTLRFRLDKPDGSPKLAEQRLADLVLVQGVFAGQAACDLVVPDEGLGIVHLFVGRGQGEINNLRTRARELRAEPGKQ